MWLLHYLVIMNFMNLACTFSFIPFPKCHLPLVLESHPPYGFCLSLLRPELFVCDRADGSTPWLTTRRRLCPICKRDIIVPKHPSQVSESSPLLQNQDQTSSTDWRDRKS